MATTAVRYELVGKTNGRANTIVFLFEGCRQKFTCLSYNVFSDVILYPRVATLFSGIENSPSASMSCYSVDLAQLLPCLKSLKSAVRNYRNSLYFRCKSIFVHRTRTKIFYANKFYNENFSDIGWLRQHTSTFRIAAAHISLYTWPLTQQAISFSPVISSARGAISSINAHHTRFDFRSILSVRKLVF